MNAVIDQNTHWWAVEWRQLRHAFPGVQVTALGAEEGDIALFTVPASPICAILTGHWSSAPWWFNRFISFFMMSKGHTDSSQHLILITQIHPTTGHLIRRPQLWSCDFAAGLIKFADTIFFWNRRRRRWFFLSKSCCGFLQPKKNLSFSPRNLENYFQFPPPGIWLYMVGLPAWTPTICLSDIWFPPQQIFFGLWCLSDVRRECRWGGSSDSVVQTVVGGPGEPPNRTCN